MEFFFFSQQVYVLDCSAAVEPVPKRCAAIDMDGIRERELSQFIDSEQFAARTELVRHTVLTNEADCVSY